MLQKNLLTKSFMTLRKDFFPRWDHDNEWRVRLSDYLGNGSGECDHEKRIIHISPQCPLGDLNITLIHEICHAVAQGGEGKRWCDRMRKAADRADALNNHTLAQQLRNEPDGYRPEVCECLSKEEIYERAEEIVSANPAITFDQLCRRLADERKVKATASAWAKSMSSE